MKNSILKYDKQYHDSLIDIIISEQKKLELMFDFRFKYVLKNKHFNLPSNRNYEIDIYLKGKDKEGIIEVKSHKKLRYYFLEHQLDVFRNNHPDAKVFLAYGNKNPTTQFKDLSFEYFKPLNDFSIDWI
jgi:hypothetical protein